MLLVKWPVLFSQIYEQYQDNALRDFMPFHEYMTYDVPEKILGRLNWALLTRLVEEGHDIPSTWWIYVPVLNLYH